MLEGRRAGKGTILKEEQTMNVRSLTYYNNGLVTSSRSCRIAAQMVSLSAVPGGSLLASFSQSSKEITHPL